MAQRAVCRQLPESLNDLVSFSKQKVIEDRTALNVDFVIKCILLFCAARLRMPMSFGILSFGRHSSPPPPLNYFYDVLTFQLFLYVPFFFFLVLFEISQGFLFLKSQPLVLLSDMQDSFSHRPVALRWVGSVLLSPEYAIGVVIHPSGNNCLFFHFRYPCH